MMQVVPDIQGKYSAVDDGKSARVWSHSISKKAVGKNGQGTTNSYAIGIVLEIQDGKLHKSRTKLKLNDSLRIAKFLF